MLHLAKLGGELETLRDDQAAYIGLRLTVHSNQNTTDTKILDQLNGDLWLCKGN
jgi:calcineurin-like phosphoesterase family protein